MDRAIEYFMPWLELDSGLSKTINVQPIDKILVYDMCVNCVYICIAYMYALCIELNVWSLSKCH
jgi:hypothetical protein